MKEWLYNKFGFGSTHVPKIDVYLVFSAFMDVSLVGTIMEICVFNTTRMNVVGDGMDTLTAQAMEGIEEDIEFNSKVAKVERTTDGEIKVV